jgi:quercetin dioxygenase-like cupin family protein
MKAKTVNAAHSFGACTATDSSSSQVAYFDSDKVAEAFAKGGILFDPTRAGKNFRVSTSRREKPGVGESHTLWTDVIYVVDGTATIVTGGTVVDAKTTEPDEIRGSTIEGGETRHLSKGDVIIIPKGVPHWFREVQGPLLYLVVKVR